MAEGEKKVKITICGGPWADRKSGKVKDALRESLGLKDEQMIVERGPGKSIKIEYINGEEVTCIMDKEGPGFFNEETPSQIVEDLREYF